MTEYVVFARSGIDWHEHSRVQARSAASAIRSAFQAVREAPEERQKEWAAVPTRSWQPVTVEVETKTALKFS